MTVVPLRLRRAALVTATVVPVALAGSAVAAHASTHTVVGTVVRAFVEHRDRQAPGARHDFGAPLTWVQPRSGPTVRVPTPELADVPVGATVSVVLGATVRDAPVADDGLRPASSVVASTVVGLPSVPTRAQAGVASVPDTVEVALVRPGGWAVGSDTTTYAELTGDVTGTVAPFWAAQTGGQVQLSVAASPDQDWFSTTADCTDEAALWQEAAAHLQFTPGAGKHLLIYVPQDAPCADGLGTVGSSLHDGGYGYVRKGSDDPPGAAYWQREISSVITHELGHNLGLEHSGSQECRATVEQGDCDLDPYGDYYDVMGASWDHMGSLNAPQEAALGLLPAAQVQDVPESASSAAYTLSPISGTTGYRALRLTTDAGDAYYVEFRPASGQDAHLGTPSAIGLDLPAGVQLRRAEPAGSSVGSALLDGTPSLSPDFAFDRIDADHDPVLPVGQAVPVGSGAFTVTVEAVGTTSRVRVSPGFGATMLPGTIASVGRSLVSPARGYRLDVQADGNLVEHAPAGDDRVIWSSGSHAAGADLEMQGDGNLVSYAPDGTALWNSGTWGNPGARLALQDDGNLVVYRADGTAAWWSGWDTPDRLRPGQFLLGDGSQVLHSPDHRFTLTPQPDGNLVVYTPDHRPVWHAGTYGNPGARTVMQPDGNLVVYAASGRVLWHSATWGNPGATTVLQDDGSLAVRGADGRTLWTSGPYRLDTLTSGGQLSGSQALVSVSGRYEAVAQSDGNLVVYADHRSRALWSSGTWGNWLSRTVQQPDGNLVVYSMPGQALWSARTWGNPGARLVVQDDGNLVVYAPSGRPLWWTGVDVRG